MELYIQLGLFFSFAFRFASFLSKKLEKEEGVEGSWEPSLEDKFSSVVSNSLSPHRLQHVREGQGTVLQLPELAQTHVHRVSDAIQPYHPLSSPSPPAFNLSQH